VDKIIIAQNSIQEIANKIHPGSYRSDIQVCSVYITLIDVFLRNPKVDFKTLDQYVIKPRGIYGSSSAIVDFLGTIGLLDEEETCVCHPQVS
jgi:hypothetical protein